MNKTGSRSGIKSFFQLLHADKVRLDKNWNYSNVISPFYRMYLIEKGTGSLINPEASFTLDPGYLYLIPSYTLCNYSCNDYLNMHYLHLTEESIDGSSLFFSNRRLFRTAAHKNEIALFERLIQLNPGLGLTSSEDPKVYETRTELSERREQTYILPLYVQMETRGIILQLLSRFVQSAAYTKRTESFSSKILDTLNFIQNNLQKNLTVAHLASRVHLHPDYFSRIFQKNIGERPLEYIQHKKIEYAQFLIITTDASFNEIAFRTGFESLSYFSRVFKNITEMSPSRYRQTNRIV